MKISKLNVGRPYSFCDVTDGFGNNLGRVRIYADCRKSVFEPDDRVILLSKDLKKIAAHMESIERDVVKKMGGL